MGFPKLSLLFPWRELGEWPPLCISVLGGKKTTMIRYGYGAQHNLSARNKIIMTVCNNEQQYSDNKKNAVCGISTSQTLQLYCSEL